MNAQLSIVFTSYNHQKFLKQALDCILGQTFVNFELIIIDDNSDDGSQFVLERYRSDKRVKLYLLTENTGSYVKASNLGASFASGEYLLFAQCDDFAEKYQIEKLMNGFKTKNVGVSFCKSNLVDENGEILGNDFDIRDKGFKKTLCRGGVIKGTTMRNFFLKSCVIPNLSAALIKRDLYHKIGGFSTKYVVAADWAFWLELCEICDFFYEPEALNNFRQHDTTIRSNVKIQRQILEIYQILFTHLKKHKLSFYDKVIKKYAAEIWASYFMQSPRAWITSFFTVASSVKVYDSNFLVNLIAGFLNKVKKKIL